MATKRLQINIDAQLVEKGNAMLAQLGLNPTTFINMVYKTFVATGKLPVRTEISERELLEEELQNIISQKIKDGAIQVKKHTSVEDFYEYAEKEYGTY